MNYKPEDLKNNTNGIITEIRELQTEKGEDYASTEDCLANYRELGWDYCAKRDYEKSKRLLKLIKRNDLAVAEAELLDKINICILALILLRNKK